MIQVFSHQLTTREISYLVDVVAVCTSYSSGLEFSKARRYFPIGRLNRGERIFKREARCTSNLSKGVNVKKNYKSLEIWMGLK